jgi:hypothetical protein
MQESLTSMESRWLEYVKSQLSTFLCHLAQSSIFSGPIHQRPLPTTDCMVFNPSHIQCSGKGLLIMESDLSDIISLYRTKNHLFHTCYFILKYQSFQDFHDTVLMVLHFRVTWLLSLIPTVAYGLWESCSKI